MQTPTINSDNHVFCILSENGTHLLHAIATPVVEFCPSPPALISCCGCFGRGRRIRPGARRGLSRNRFTSRCGRFCIGVLSFASTAVGFRLLFLFLSSKHWLSIRFCYLAAVFHAGGISANARQRFFVLAHLLDRATSPNANLSSKRTATPSNDRPRLQIPHSPYRDLVTSPVSS